MKKFFTLICALMAFNAAFAQEVCKHSYVLVADDWNGAGTLKIDKGASYGDGFFVTPTGHDKATNKGSVDLSDAETWGEDIAKKYGEYGKHLNSMRIKNAQDVLSMKVTADSKVIIFYNGQNKVGTAARYPKIATNAALTEGVQNPGPTADTPAIGVNKLEWTAPDDMTIFIGSYNGDTYISYIIVEAKEAEGTPSVKVGPQTFGEDGLWYREVTCKPGLYWDDNEGDYLTAVVTYTTDGSTPTAESPVYEEPIKCYQNQVVKFQAFMELGDGVAYEEFILRDADNEGIVSFSFDAPTVSADGADVTVTTSYENATNYIKVGDEDAVAANEKTLTESATVSAYTVIKNGSYAEFKTNPTITDVYVLSPITEKTVVSVTAGTAVEDEESTADPKPYIIKDGAISADKAHFFVKNLTFAAVKDSKYQIDGQEAYIQMSNTNITFKLDEAAGVTVVCSKNSCKTLNEKDDDAVTTARQIYVNVDGTTYGCDDITAGDVNNIDGYQNVIKFDLEAGIHTFLKYSGTGNIMISSITIEPGVSNAIAGVSEKASVAKVAKALVNGQLVIKSAKGTFSAAGAQIK